jgi:pentose-5-phosphate-3-epimerase
MTFLILTSILLAEIGVPFITWMTVDGGLKTNALTAVIETASGDIVIVGGSASFGNGDMDAWVIQLERHDR